MSKGGVSLFSKGVVDSALNELFTTSLNKEPLKARPAAKPKPVAAKSAENFSEADGSDASDIELDDDEQVSEDDEDNDEDEESDDDDDEANGVEESDSDKSLDDERLQPASKGPRKKRKRDDDDADLESKYLDKLARSEDAEVKRKKRQKAESGEAVNPSSEDDEAESEESDFEIPKHETQDGSIKKDEVDQANRTVFLGNVSTDAIKSKESMKKLKKHLVSFLDSESREKSQQQIESIRFRSVAFASTALPRKAAFAQKDLMDATTKSTNAYAVYISAALAKTAVQKLNGTIVLDRHLRVDSIAHPAAVDHRRCVFVGNLGFVDDESLMQDNGDGDEEKKPKKKKQPGDVEEGLWRQFGKAGSVESVRVIRDKSTRVGKGFAYVQFTDQVAVEKALEFNEKKFPPLLPRVLRVTRAKKITKTNAYKEKQGKGRPDEAPNGKVYNPKANPEMQTAKGRATKMFGRAGAAQMKKGKRRDDSESTIRRPEDFVFEGHRARDAEGKGTMNLKQKKKGGKPTTRSSRRGAAFKAGGGKK